MSYEPPDPAVARVIAQEVLRRGGEYRANIGQLHALFRREIPDSPAAASPPATATYVRWARPDLGRLGIAVRRDQPSVALKRREWVFRLVAVPGETAPPTPDQRP